MNLDKYLKKINFKEKVNTSFTEQSKKNVLEKINKIEQKHNNKKHYFQDVFTVVFSIGVIIFGFTFFYNNLESSNEKAAEPQNEFNLPNNKESIEVLGTEDEDKESQKLKVGGYYKQRWDALDLKKWDSKTNTISQYDYSDPNYNLFLAHLSAAMITDNGLLVWLEEIDEELYKEYLNSILVFLNKIEPSEEKINEFQKAVQLAEQAINNNVKKGDSILDELHLILHDLDEYYNAEPFIDGYTDEFGNLWPTLIKD